MALALLLAVGVISLWSSGATSTSLVVGAFLIQFMVQGLWQFLEVTSDMLTPAQVSLVVRRSLKRIADMAIPKRRARTCPRKLRQPVSSWPRLRKNTCGKGAVDYSVGEIYA